VTVLLEGAARPLLIAHAVLGLAAVGASTHLAAYAVLAARGRHVRALRRFTVIAPAVVVPQFILGLLLYPAYRVHVRLADFDRTAPILSQLFDFKEHLAAIALAVVCAASVAGRLATPKAAATDEAMVASARWSVAALATAGAALIWTVALLGLYVTARHPVGMR